MFSETKLIYGLELSPAVQTAAAPRINLDYKQVIAHIDYYNAKKAPVKSDSERRIIDISVRICRAVMSRRSINPRFARCPSGCDISDRPSRLVKIPYRIKNDRVSRMPGGSFTRWSEAGRLKDKGFSPRLAYLEDTNLSKSALGHIADGRSDFRLTILMVSRPMSSPDDTDSEIAEWLGRRPPVSHPSGIGVAWSPEHLAARISHRRRILVNLTTHRIRQIEVEAQVHFSGLTD